MLNIIWIGMMVLSVVFGMALGKVDDVVQALTSAAKLAFDLGLGLMGIMAFWLGIMAIAKESGLMQVFARLLRPVLKRLFPDVPVDHPAMGSMLMNITANMLGIGNAATPFGLKAMADLQTLNTDKTRASDAMCVFLAINTSSVQLIPVTAIAFLAANGSTNPSSVVVSSLIATLVSTVVAVISVKKLAVFPLFKLQPASTV